QHEPTGRSRRRNEGVGYIRGEQGHPPPAGGVPEADALICDRGEAVACRKRDREAAGVAHRCQAVIEPGGRGTPLPPPLSLWGGCELAGRLEPFMVAQRRERRGQPRLVGLTHRLLPGDFGL